MSKHHYCQLQIGLLGPFNLIVDQKEIKESVWKSKKALTMLKYLATRKGQKVSADMLIELLWPDNEDVDSTSNLHTAVWFVRRMLTSKNEPKSESRLRYSNGSYWLELRDGCVDIDLFEGHVQKSRQMVKADPIMALFHCEAALELYRDDFLADDIYDEWTISYREDYQDLYFETILRSAELLMEHRGDLQGAIDILRSAVKRDPYREELYQKGIELYILAERHVDAVNLYQRYSKMLMDEFHLQPSLATQELIMQIQETGNEPKAIYSSLLDVEPKTGAYICDPQILHFLIKTEQRRLARRGNNFSVLLILNKEQIDLNRKMQAVFHILQRSLRISDLISQYSDDLVVVFLPDTDATESKALSRRLKQNLQQGRIDMSTLSYTLLNSEQLETLQKRIDLLLA